MTKTITHDDVLRYIYKETSEEENLAIEKQLLVDASLMEYIKQIQSSISKINQLELEPSKKVVQDILSFSSSFRCESIS